MFVKSNPKLFILSFSLQFSLFSCTFCSHLSVQCFLLLVAESAIALLDSNYLHHTKDSNAMYLSPRLELTAIIDQKCIHKTTALLCRLFGFFLGGGTVDQFQMLQGVIEQGGSPTTLHCALVFGNPLALCSMKLDRGCS